MWCFDQVFIGFTGINADMMFLNFDFCRHKAVTSGYGIWKLFPSFYAEFCRQFLFRHVMVDALHSVFISAGRAKTVVAAKRDEFKVVAMRTGIHGTTKRRVATMNHFINVFNLSLSGMKSI